jgi:hypothetical protein
MPCAQSDKALFDPRAVPAAALAAAWGLATAPRVRFVAAGAAGAAGGAKAKNVPYALREGAGGGGGGGGRENGGESSRFLCLLYYIILYYIILFYIENAYMI